MKNKDLLEYLRTRRLSSVDRSISASEQYQAAVKNHASQVKVQLLEDQTDSSFTAAPGQYLATLFFRMLNEHSQTNTYSKRTTAQTKRSVSFWDRVVSRVEESGVSPEVFMRAQFSWFHKNFGTTPKRNQLVTDASVERALLFSGNADRAVVGNNIKHTLSSATMFKHCEQQLRNICRAQKVSREEFYRRFVLTGNMTFPKAFLDADPVYKRVTQEHERT